MFISQGMKALLLWVATGGVAVWSVRAFSPPPPVPATAPPEVFSAERAAADLPMIAAAPHSVGTLEHEAVRLRLLARLRAMGLAPEVESGTGVTTVEQLVVAAAVSNILVRLPGSHSTEAVLLAAHYDSVATGPGAADDGAGVVTLLETLRALQHGAPLKNDVLALFTDGEEHGLTGAELYMASRRTLGAERLAGEPVGVVLNFDNRGDRGVVMMFETSPGDAWLIEALASTPAAFGSSLLSTAYQFLPNNTDFTIFRQGGFAGLNFAMGERLEAYHTTLDTPGNVSWASLQQMGSYALPLTRTFGMSDFHEPARKVEDAVFFNSFGRGLVHYNVAWVLPLQGALTALLLALLIFDPRRKRTKAWRVIAGLLLVLAGAAVIGGMMGVVVLGLERRVGSSLLLGDTPSNGLLLLASIAVGVGAAAFFQALWRYLLGSEALATAGLLIFWSISLLTSVKLPGSSHLFFWPLAFVLSGLALQRGMSERWWPGLALLASLPGILLFGPLFFLLYVFLTATPLTASIIGICFFLVCSLNERLMESLVPNVQAGRRVLAVASLIAVVCSAVSFSLSHFSAVHPRRDSIAYAINLSGRRAAWISSDEHTDPWTAQFLGGQPSRSLRPDLVGAPTGTVLWKEAALVESKGPRLLVAQDRTRADGREVEILIVPQQGGDRVDLRWGVNFSSFEIQGRNVNLQVDNHDAGNLGLSGAPRTLLYFGVPPEGIRVRFRAPSGVRLILDVTEQVPGLPAGVGGPPLLDRPQAFVPAAGSDITSLRRTCEL